MSENAREVLTAFESLTQPEQREILTALLGRVVELQDPLLTDEHLSALADELFQALDAEESNGCNAPAR